MKKDVFLQELRAQLSGLPSHEVDDIIRDQDEYIRDAINAGRSEEQVIQSLGEPKNFAASVRAESKIHRAESSPTLKKQIGLTLGAAFAILALAPLNLIFFLGPFIAIVAVGLGGWGTAGGALVGSLAALVGFFYKALFVSAGFWTHLTVFFFILGCIGVSLLSLWLMYKITQVVVRMTISYLKWNLNFIRGRA